MYRKLNPAGSTPREISEVVNNLVEGKSNNTGTITLTTGWATTTTIYDVTCITFILFWMIRSEPTLMIFVCHNYTYF